MAMSTSKIRIDVCGTNWAMKLPIAFPIDAKNEKNVIVKYLYLALNSNLLKIFCSKIMCQLCT